MTILFLTVLSFLIFFSYTAIVIIRFGVPRSLSHSYYLFKNWTDEDYHGKPESEKKLNKFWISWFGMCIVTLALSLLPAWLELSEGSNFQFLSFLACGSLVFVGVAPRFLSDTQERIHYFAALISAICSILWCLLVPDNQFLQLFSFVYGTLLILAISIFSGTLLSKRLFWIEIWSFTITYMLIILTMLQKLDIVH